MGAIGSNPKDGGAFGFLGGNDLQFHQHAGVYGESDQQGVMGLTTVPKGTGVFGGGTATANGDQIGVRGETQSGVGVQGQSFGEGVAVQGHSLSGDKGLAGRFIGNVHIQGNPDTSSGDLRVEGTSSFGGNVKMDQDVEIKGTLNASVINCAGNINAFDVALSGGDCAEDFDIVSAEAVDPGSVMVIDDEGALRLCQDAYDKKVTGVISGAGDYKPGIVLDKRPSAANRPNRLPLALVGKVYCKVDAQHSPIEVGDLLTTSPTPGHAMRATDMQKAFGAVIGKALRPLATGQGTIPILIALQ